MIDLDKEFEKRVDALNNTQLDNYEFKSIFTSISDDVRKLLVEADSNNEYNKSPNLVIISVVSLEKDNPCGVCMEAYNQLIQWGKDSGYVGDGKARVLIVTEFDNKKIWYKLNASFDQSPRHYIFDKNFALYDVVDGVMTGSYIETFYGKLLK